MPRKRNSQVLGCPGASFRNRKEYDEDEDYEDKAKQPKKPKKSDLFNRVSDLEEIVYSRFLTYKQNVGEENTLIIKMNRLRKEKRENPGVECGLMVLMDEPNNPGVHAGSCIADLKDAEVYLNAYNETLIETISTLSINRQMMNQTIAALEAEEDLIDGTQDESEDDEFEDGVEDLIDESEDEDGECEYEDGEFEDGEFEDGEKYDELAKARASKGAEEDDATCLAWREEADLWKRAAETGEDVKRRMAKEIADLQEQLRNNKAALLNANEDADAAKKEITDLQEQLRNNKAALLNAKENADAAKKEIADLQEQLRNEKDMSLNANEDTDAAKKEIADLQEQLCVAKHKLCEAETEIARLKGPPEIDILTPTCDAHKDRPDPEKTEIPSQPDFDFIESRITLRQLQKLSAWMKKEMKKKNKMSCCPRNCVANAVYPVFYSGENGPILNMSNKFLNDTCETCCRNPTIPEVDDILGFDGKLIKQACHIAGTEK